MKNKQLDFLDKNLSFSSGHVCETYERCSGKITALVMEGEGNDCAYINTHAHLKYTILQKGKSKYLFTAP